MVPKGGTVADIGSDHALLPVFLVETGTAQRAVAGEINDGPLQAARKQVAEAGLNDRISVRQGDGLDVISPGEADTIVIAGMGGGTIADILTRGEAAGKLSGVSRLVLQPNIGERIVREWFLSYGWKLVQERLLEEDGITYEILVAEQTSSCSDAEEHNRELYSKELPFAGFVPKELRLLMGPYLLSAPNRVFLEKWSAYADKLDRMIEQIGKSEALEAKRKRDALIEERKGVKEVLACLSEYVIS